KVIIGYLNSDTTPQIVAETMRYMTTGTSNLPTKNKLLQPAGYPTFSGAMFWTIDADRREDYRYSNVVGPLLHGMAKEPRRELTGLVRSRLGGPCWRSRPSSHQPTRCLRHPSAEE